MRVTASKIGLLGHCQYWAREGSTWDPWRGSPAAERGTRFHSAIDRFIRTGILESYEDDIRSEMLAAVQWLTTSGWSREELHSEVAFGWSPAFDTVVEYDIASRGYPDDGRFHGTADLVIDAGGKLFVYDWKTGDGSKAGPQLRALGLMAARRFGHGSVTVAALEVTASGVREACREELDAFTLAAIAGEMANDLASVDGSEPAPGSHCSELYCPARLACPLGVAATADVVDVIPADALVRAKPYKLTDPITTPDHAAWAIDVVRLVSARLDAIKDDIKARVPESGWRLEDGRLLRETKSQVAIVDKEQALALAKSLGATDEQLSSCVRSFERSNGLRVTGTKTKKETKEKAA